MYLRKDDFKIGIGICSIEVFRQTWGNFCFLQFPKSCCTSVNEVICHGIPDKRPLQDGDIVNIDVTVYHRDYHGDLNEMLFVGTPSDKAKKLVNNTWECLEKVWPSKDLIRAIK